MFYAYVLRSESSGKLYKGHTNDLERRLREHNDPDRDARKYTKKDPGPWVLVFHEPFETRSEAMKREKFYKSGQGREWLRAQLTGQA